MADDATSDGTPAQDGAASSPEADAAPSREADAGASRKADAAPSQEGTASNASRPGPEPEQEPAAPVARKEARSAPSRPLTETEIDSPDLRTLVSLFVVFAVTAASWGAARFACNMHPPESRPPPKLSTDRLAANPKDAAIELVQRWQSYDFTGALELASGEAAAELRTAEADCKQRANECARQREASAGLLTTAVVLRQDGFTADTTVTTLLKGEKRTYDVRLAREGFVWKGLSRRAK